MPSKLKAILCPLYMEISGTISFTLKALGKYFYFTPTFI